MKLKILCIHGLEVNSVIYRSQLKEYIDRYGKYADFEFVDGEYILEKSDVFSDELYNYIKKYDNIISLLLHSWVLDVVKGIIINNYSFEMKRQPTTTNGFR